MMMQAMRAVPLPKLVKSIAEQVREDEEQRESGILGKDEDDLKTQGSEESPARVGITIPGVSEQADSPSSDRVAGFLKSGRKFYIRPQMEPSLKIKSGSSLLWQKLLEPSRQRMFSRTNRWLTVSFGQAIVQRLI
jgi:hypothetical protein